MSSLWRGEEMKKKIRIKEICPKQKDDLQLPSKIIMKTSGEGLNFCRKFKIKNDGGLWTNPNETRLSLKVYDTSNTLGKPEVTIKLRDGREVNMSFLDMAYLRDILVHIPNLEVNYFNDTVVVDSDK
jgi:hypothetical protein